MDTSSNFPGFRARYKKDFFTYPIELENYWHLFSGADQKILDFILRRTLGWGKTSDAISLSQFTNGIGKKQNGSGVSRAQVSRSLNKLEELGFIKTVREKYKTTVIHLALKETTHDEEVEDSNPSPIVVHLIELFKPIAPGLTDGYLRRRKERAAIERMLTAYGPETLEYYIQTILTTNGEQYAPVIVCPSEMETKLPKLILYLQKKKQGGQVRFAVD